MPFVPSSVLLLLVVRPGAPSSVLSTKIKMDITYQIPKVIKTLVLSGAFDTGSARQLDLSGSLTASPEALQNHLI